MGTVVDTWAVTKAKRDASNATFDIWFYLVCIAAFTALAFNAADRGKWWGVALNVVTVGVMGWLMNRSINRLRDAERRIGAER